MKKKITELNREVQNYRITQDEDEVSLIDIAKMIIRRRRIFYIVFAIIFSISLFLAIHKFITRVKVLVSVYKVALEGAPAEPPSSLIEVINSFYKDVVLTEINDARFLNYEVKTTNPGGTLYLQLTSEVSEADIERIKILHSKILQKVKEGQDSLLAKDLKSLEERLRDSKLELELIRREKENMWSIRHEKAPEALVGFTGQIMTLEARIKDMERQKFYFKEGEVLQIASEKPVKLGSGALKVLGVGILMAFILGIMGVFIYEFIDKVKESIIQENAQL